MLDPDPKHWYIVASLNVLIDFNKANGYSLESPEISAIKTEAMKGAVKIYEKINRLDSIYFTVLQIRIWDPELF
jgi:hypothetical protein